MGRMAAIFDQREIEISTSSGMLIVRIHPRIHWLPGLAMLAGDVLFAMFLYRFWTFIPWFVRIIYVLILVSTVPTWIYELAGEEILEFDSQKLTVRRGIHGWERKQEYRISECSDLEWHRGRKGNSSLGCKAGRSTVHFGKKLSENDANKILTALQQTLPDVAQKICSYPTHHGPFLTLGLNKP
jgi:hypothetical protein